METNFNFKSAICTSVDQSRRLLELGLKKETADMFWTNPFGDWIAIVGDGNTDENNIPAWSLGRLVKDFMPQSIGHLELAVGGDYVGYYEFRFEGIHWEYAEETPDMFDNIISTIEWLIKEGYFNKEYLEE